MQTRHKSEANQMLARCARGWKARHVGVLDTRQLLTTHAILRLCPRTQVTIPQLDPAELRATKRALVRCPLPGVSVVPSCQRHIPFGHGESGGRAAVVYLDGTRTPESQHCAIDNVMRDFAGAAGKCVLALGVTACARSGGGRRVPADLVLSGLLSQLARDAGLERVEADAEFQMGQGGLRDIPVKASRSYAPAMIFRLATFRRSVRSLQIGGDVCVYYRGPWAPGFYRGKVEALWERKMPDGADDVCMARVYFLSDDTFDDFPVHALWPLGPKPLRRRN